MTDIYSLTRDEIERKLESFGITSSKRSTSHPSDDIHGNYWPDFEGLSYCLGVGGSFTTFEGDLQPANVTLELSMNEPPFSADDGEILTIDVFTGEYFWHTGEDEDFPDEAQEYLSKALRFATELKKALES